MSRLNSTNKMAQSMRSGHHATVYEVRRDPELKNKNVIRDKNKVVFPFVGGAQYKGQWSGDQKEGFGIQVNPDDTKYEGEWFAGQYHGRGTLWIKKNKKIYARQYVGDWVNGLMDGEGIFYYNNGEIYRGEWLQSRKHGSGRYDYENGDSYFGEWNSDLQDGFGTMNYANGNIFEGLWVHGKKEGPGLYYYASTRKVYQGEWLDDQPRCGEFRIPNAEEALRLVRPLAKGVFHNDFALPQIGLANSRSIVDMAVSAVRMQSLNKSYARMASPSEQTINPRNLEAAKTRFHELCAAQGDAESSTVSIHQSRPVFNELGLNLSGADLDAIISQLALQDSLHISFAELLEIAVYIHGEKVSGDGGGGDDSYNSSTRGIDSY